MKELADTGVPTKVVRNGIKELLSESSLSKSDKKQLTKQLVSHFKAQRKATGNNDEAIEQASEKITKPVQQSAFDEILFLCQRNSKKI